MKKYRLVFSKQADKFLKKHQDIENRIIKFFSDFVNTSIINLKKYDIKAMQSMKDYFRLRLGDYRIIYTIQNDEFIIFIVKVGNRGDVYKK